MRDRMDYSLNYMMAAEKMINLIFTIENTLMFMKEYEIKPDAELKKALIPVLVNLNVWMNEELK